MAKIIPNILEVAKATMADYHALERYHYCPGKMVCPTGLYKIRARYPHSKALPNPLAVIVYRMPFSQLRARTKPTDGFFNKPEKLGDRLKLLGENVRYIARVIVDPRFRRLGIATKLIKETLSLQGVPLIEAITPIDWTNRMFVKAGFTLYRNPAPVWYRKMMGGIKKIGLEPDFKLLPETLQHRINSLTRAQTKHFNWQIHDFMYHFRHRADMSQGIERTRFILSKIPYPEAYLIWKNPELPLTSE